MLRPPLFLGVILAVVLIGLPLAAGRTAPAATDDGQKLQIQADSGIEWRQDAHLYIARGNAVAKRGTSEIHADTLIAHYRDVKSGGRRGNTGGNTEIYRVEAQGHVLLKRGAQTVVGDRAVWDVDRALAIVTGKHLKLTTATDTVTAHDSLEWYDQKQIAVARGNAVASRSGKTVKADILTAYLAKATPGRRETGAAHRRPPVTRTAAPGAAAENSKISRVDAQGRVVISNGLDTGRGDFGVYNAESGIATLIGHVVIQRGKDVIRGQRGVMDLNRNISRMLPGRAPGGRHQRVQGLFVRKDHTARPAASAAAPNAGPADAGAGRR